MPMRGWGMLVVAGMCAAAAAQDAPARVRLEHRVSEGLVVSVERITTKELRYRFAGVKGGEGEDATVPAAADHVERVLFTDTIVAADRGQPRRIERQMHVVTSTALLHPSEQRTTERKPLHGRTLRLERGDADVWRVTTATGAPLDAAVAADLHPLPIPAAFLPAVPVAVGEQWTLDAAAVRRVLGDASPDLEIRVATGTLASVARVDGRRLARVELQLSWVSTHREVMLLEATLAGPCFVDVGAGRIVRVDLTGTLTMHTRPEARRRGVVAADVEGRLGLRWRVWSGRPAAEDLATGARR